MSAVRTYVKEEEEDEKEVLLLEVVKISLGRVVRLLQLSSPTRHELNARSHARSTYIHPLSWIYYNPPPPSTV